MIKTNDRPSPWRLRFANWHRRIGVAVSLLALWLAVTGLLLNHNDQLQLDQNSVNSQLLMTLYGIEPPQVVSYPVGDGWLSHLGDNRVYLDKREVAYCTPPLSGALLQGTMIVAACGGGLLLLSTEGEIIERLGETYGFPQPVLRVADSDNLLILDSQQGAFSFDLELLSWQPYAGIQPQWIEAAQPPTLLATYLREESLRGGLNWERVLLDLHSGRLAGYLGVLLMDAVAILMAVLAISGLWVWHSRRRH